MCEKQDLVDFADDSLASDPLLSPSSWVPLLDPTSPPPSSDETGSPADALFVAGARAMLSAASDGDDAVFATAVAKIQAAAEAGHPGAQSALQPAVRLRGNMMAGEGNGDEEGWRRSGIEVSALQFAYDGQPPIFARFNLRVVPGSRCLLVGANGSVWNRDERTGEWDSGN